MNTFLRYNFSFIHLFHCVSLPISLEDDAPHFAEPTLSNYKIEFEVVAAYLNFVIFLLAFVLNYYFVLFLVFAR
jgi:hypothetical protein